MIIASLGVSIKEYVKDYLQLLAGLVFMCSVCSSPTHRQGGTIVSSGDGCLTSCVSSVSV